MRVYCVSDSHFGHDREIIRRPKGFGGSILNSIGDFTGDILLHLGDFCIGDDEHHHEMFMIQARGFKKKILVRGNHDKKSDNWYLEHGWDFVCEMFWGRYFGKQIVFSHMPMVKQAGNAFTPHFDADFNIHGHLHGNNHREGHWNTAYDYSYYYDLAPEIHNYKLINLEHIVERLCQNKKQSELKTLEKTTGRYSLT